MIQANNKWIREVQREMEKTKLFENQKTLLHLFQDGNNLWRCGGSIENAPYQNVSYQVKYPYILDTNHYFTKLIIAFHHRRVKQWRTRNVKFNSCRVLDSTGWKYFSSIFKCSICKKNEGKPYSHPQHSHLPKEKLSEGLRD